MRGNPKKVEVSRQLTLYMQFKGEPEWRIKFLAERLSWYFGREAFGLIREFEKAGWTFADLYHMNQVARRWRHDPQRILDLQRALIEVGCSQILARNLSQRPTYFSAAPGQVVAGAKLLLGFGFNDPQILALDQTRPGFLLQPLGLLRKFFPELSEKQQVHVEIFEMQLALCPPSEPNNAVFVPGRFSTEPFYPSQPLGPKQSAEVAPEFDDSEDTEMVGSDLDMFMFASNFMATNIQPGDMEMFDDPSESPSPDPKPVKLSTAILHKPIRFLPKPAIPKDEPVDSVTDWNEVAPEILKTIVPDWDQETDWKEFCHANPSLLVRKSRQARALDVIRRWFFPPGSSIRDSTGMYLAASIMMGRDFCANGRTGINPIKSNPALRSILELDDAVVYFRIHVLLRVLDLHPGKQPDLLLHPFEQVEPMDSIVGLPGFSVPPPPTLERDFWISKRQEVLFRVSEIDRRGQQANRKPFIDMLSEPLRHRFNNRLEKFLQALARRAGISAKPRPAYLSLA